MWVVFLFCLAVNLDALFAAVAYGIKGIKLSVFNILIIVFIDCAMLAVSVFVGGLLYNVVAEYIMIIIGAAVLIGMGVYNITAAIVRAIKNRNKTKADDEERIKELNLNQTILLAVALGFDALVSGFACGFDLLHGLVAVCVMFVLAGLFIGLGNTLGRVVKSKVMVDLSWIGGLILILIAVFRILPIFGI